MRLASTALVLALALGGCAGGDDEPEGAEKPRVERSGSVAETSPPERDRAEKRAQTTPTKTAPTKTAPTDKGRDAAGKGRKKAHRDDGEPTKRTPREHDKPSWAERREPGTAGPATGIDNTRRPRALKGAALVRCLSASDRLDSRASRFEKQAQCFGVTTRTLRRLIRAGCRQNAARTRDPRAAERRCVRRAGA